MENKAVVTTDSWAYKAVVAFGYGAVLSIFLYEAFNFEAGHEGIETLHNLAYDEEASRSANTFFWVLASSLVASEMATNVLMLAPVYEAKRFFGIEDEDNSNAYLDESLLPPEEQVEVIRVDAKPSFFSCNPTSFCSFHLIHWNHM